MVLLHVPVSTKRPRIHYFNYPICDCSELNNAAARASDTPTEMEIRRQPQRRSATRARCVVDGGGGGGGGQHQCSKTTICHMPRDVLLLHVPVSTKLPWF